ncbi:RecQ family ATP-dependent DNA helicase [uncultured Bifidobacterium sp.]|uniref:RecQ family ATP-dependent DNA helicase n=1 Tax=uncultured Bifidobacterium sp. TaxID=165187 RepID=UPI00258C241E|nr:RecQ family ATP-dependent DNA helicase [uncultured Bifidobacterium sp.]
MTDITGDAGLPSGADNADAVEGTAARALAALKRYFGYDSFRPGQEGLVETIMAGRDVLGVMPTGAGKSVCYQIPAALLPGVTIVVSPLISLMRDQVDGLNDAGLNAAYINTTQDPDEQGMVLAQAAAGQIRLLYVAPERLETERFQRFAAQVPIALVAVDEAHCVSQWGQDFRSAYLGIGEFIASLPQRPTVAAFTATATERVRRDIVTLLGLRDPLVTVTGFDRPNLYFDVIRMENKHKASWVAQYIAAHPQDSGIVYCSTRKETEALAETINQIVPQLRAAAGTAFEPAAGAGVFGAGDGRRVVVDTAENGGAAGPSAAGAETFGGDGGASIAVAYHGGMLADRRGRAQRDFVTDRVPVVVATNAFGMGIDKSNVRFVIHHNMPESIEAYYQEAGRAGRDGEPSRCTLLWNEGDIVTRRRLLDTDNENERLTLEEREIVRMSRRRLLDGMIGYCRTTDCLHRYMTRYFGESDDGRDAHCGNCSNCESTFETIDVTDIARAISRCVHDVNQSFGSGKIVAVLRGSQAQDVVSRGLDRCPSYGVLRDVPEARVRDVLSQMATDGFLFISEGRLPIVRFGPRAAETVTPEFRYAIKRVERREGAASGRGAAPRHVGGTYGTGGSPAVAAQDAAELTDADEMLFERLRALRRDIAQEIGKPPYIVFSDKTLRDMCARRPRTPAEFLEVHGVGENKLNLYGERFLAAIAESV